MDLKTIKELIKLIGESNLSEVRIEDGEFKITIRTQNFADNKMSAAPVHMYSAPAPQAPVAAPIAAPLAPLVKEISAPVAPAAEAGGKTIEVKSPMVGTFYRSPGPGKPTLVQVGDTIEKGSKVCIIEAMKLFNEVESEYAGKVIKVLVDDASPVEYEQPLFLLEIQ